MKLHSVVQNENEQTIKKIRSELYFLYTKQLQTGTFTEELVGEIESYIQKRLKEEELKMNWFPIIWSDDDIDKEFTVTVSLIVKSKKELTIRMSSALLKNKEEQMNQK